jgi:hypothetical protein
VTHDEQAVSGIPAGTAVPASVERKVLLGLSGPVEDLVEAGVVPSAEVFG